MEEFQNTIEGNTDDEILGTYISKVVSFPLCSQNLQHAPGNDLI